MVTKQGSHLKSGWAQTHEALSDQHGYLAECHAREREREKKKIERKREKRKRRRDMNELLGFDIANNLIIDTLTLSNLTDSGAQQLAYML